MQSILQYRRLGRSLRADYERYTGNDVSQPDSLQTSGNSSSNQTQQRDVSEIERALDSEKNETGCSGTSSPLSSSCTEDGVSTNQGPSEVSLTVGDIVRESNYPRTTLETGTNLQRDGQDYVVRSGNDRDLDPRKWALSLKIWITFLIYLHGSVVGIASSIDSAALNHIRTGFDHGELTESLTIGLFLIGFGIGALFAGPLSQTFGRNPVFICSWVLYMICIMASSLSPVIGFQLSFRLLAGFFGSAPLTCGGPTIGDLWSPMDRIYTFPVFANAAIMGPVIGPVFGGFIGANTRHSWRWTEWTDLCAASVVFLLTFFTQPETYAPVLLKWKAKHLRNITGDQRYQTETEMHLPTQSVFSRWTTIIVRPFQVTVKEPILVLLTFWLTLIWIIMFAFLKGYKIMFRSIYQTSEGQTGLCFAGIATGLIISSSTVPVIAMLMGRDLRKIRRNGGHSISPESRLWYGLLSAPAVPLALFWMAWTDRRAISIWSPLAASVLLGYGLLGMFTAGCEYIVYVYGSSASPAALACNIFTRYIVAGLMAEVSPVMWQRLGVSWTLTMLGCIAAVLAPVPYVFWRWGPRLRARSRFASNMS